MNDSNIYPIAASTSDPVAVAVPPTEVAVGTGVIEVLTQPNGQTVLVHHDTIVGGTWAVHRGLVGRRWSEIEDEAQP